jgi:putative addiction module CopG family antidote
MPSKRTATVALTEHLDGLIKTELASGRYRTVSEVIRSGLRRLEAQNLRAPLNNSRAEVCASEGAPDRVGILSADGQETP